MRHRAAWAGASVSSRTSAVGRPCGRACARQARAHGPRPPPGCRHPPRPAATRRRSRAAAHRTVDVPTSASSSSVRLSTVNGRSVRMAGTAAAAATSSAKPSTSRHFDDRRRPEAHRGAGHDDTGALGADQGPRDVEAALRQQPVEGVTGDASGPGRQLGPQQVLVRRGEPSQWLRQQPGWRQRQLARRRARRAGAAPRRR